eukprot:Blabericola_migrator_1__4992@NODE_2594_length_2560_cov_201_764541_g1626_i0_p1_GENE_NODE_2594_length_2560_cov_201_764541_g1626_i0NODE_2594_length_2560_cov_201_764541_g1626_i0_p1_ORF_typecomplete_len799_score136_93RHD3/PF05879_12/5_9e78GBP/PF02263_19/1_1e10MMR_HSR1/PF01926_23/7_1e05Dynamin_N/PF00350_23/0_00046Dynamin_N/PF00350_23/6_6e03AIG1/PF04548_16/0_00035AIG1/PF04548_16/6_9e03FeoB_N/PF02421_18/0_0093AAA_15/PF13175_6/0_046PPV_E1_C/PF00519_17/0_021DGCR6/PF07324_11/0_011DGCR6/PF07324_11/7_1e03eIF
MTEIVGSAATLQRRSSRTQKGTVSTSTSTIDSSHSKASDLVQIIDFDGNFCQDFEAHLKTLGIARCGFKYNVLTVLGCQSSGKSTLLNSLFGTTFPEMNSMAGRSQTTKGIWVAKDGSTNTLVVDVEGTDSRERGENRLTFEHRASLFSLAIADAVIINLWYTDLGRYAASNLGLLKTVMAVNLELFQQEVDTKKTTLVFVIRDHSTAATPLEMLNQMLLNDVYEIWNDIKKPTELRQARVTDYFDIVVVGMPSKVADPAGYRAGVSKLRRRWFEEIAPSTYSRQVPADGFAFYAKAVWDAILNSAELNIPSQKEMVATYRCEEIRQATLAKILPRIVEVAAADPTRLFDEHIAEDAIKEAIEMYHRDAWRYQENIYTKKKDQLLESLYNEIQKPLEKHLYSTRQQLVKERTKDIEALCRRDEWDTQLMANRKSVIEFWESLRTELTTWRSNVIKDFDDICGHAAVNCVVEIEAQPQPIRHEVHHVFETELIRRTLEEALDETTNKIMIKETSLFREHLANRVDEIRQEVEALYNIPVLTAESLWGAVEQLLKVKCETLYGEYGKAIQGIDQPETAASSRSPQDNLTLMVILILKDLLSKRIEWLPELIHKRFVKYFESDEKEVPYYWASLSQDKIKTIYLSAKEQAETLLPVISSFDLNMKNLTSKALELSESEERALRTPLITSESKKVEISNAAAKRMLKSCQDAQFVQATGGKVSAPAWWWWGLLIVLGWNEFMAVLQHPFFMMGILMLACLLGATYYTGNIRLVLDTGRNLSSLLLGVVIPLLTSIQGGSSSD